MLLKHLFTFHVMWVMLDKLSQYTNIFKGGGGGGVTDMSVNHVCTPDICIMDRYPRYHRQGVIVASKCQEDILEKE